MKTNVRDRSRLEVWITGSEETVGHFQEKDERERKKDEDKDKKGNQEETIYIKKCEETCNIRNNCNLKEEGKD